MELEELKEKITETIKIYNPLIDLNRMRIKKLETDKKYAEELGDMTAALDFEKKLIKARAEMLGYLDTQARLKSLLK